jgi:tetratricopeptide (TPR) repeat protein
MEWLNSIIEQIKNISAGVDQYKKETVIQSLPAHAHVNRAKKLIEKEKYEEARAILLKALELPQKEALVYKYIGIIYDKLSDFPAAAEAYQDAADLNPHDKTIWQQLGFALMTTNKYNEAEKAFENANTILPHNTDTLTGWGMALMKLNRLLEAAEKFQRAAEVNKYNFSAIFLGAVLDMKAGDYGKAESKLAYLVKVSPNESNSYEYANLKFIKGDIENAIHYAKKAVEFNHSILPAYILLGRAYAKRHDKENSLYYFKAAEYNELTTANLYMEWGVALIKFGEYASAQEKLLRAALLEPDNAEVKDELALANVLLGIETPLSDSNSRVAKVSRGILEASPELLRQTLSDEEDDSISYYYLAKFSAADSKIRGYYESAIAKNPCYIQAFIGFAGYLISKEDFAEAQRKLRKAIKIDENNLKVLNLLFFASYMLVKENGSEYNKKEALKIARKIEEISPEAFEYKEEAERLRT